MPGAEYKAAAANQILILKYPLETCDTTPLRAVQSQRSQCWKLEAMSSTGSVLTQPANEKFRILIVGIISVIITIKDLNLLNRKIS